MKGVSLLVEEYIKSFVGNMTIGFVMTAFGAGIVGYFGCGMTIKDIITVGEIGVYGYGVGVLMNKMT